MLTGNGKFVLIPLSEMSRESKIDWLCWNDGNGCYSDEDRKAEDWPVLTDDEASLSIMDVLEEN